jgi:hypothetical protein
MRASALDEQVSDLLHAAVRSAAEGHFEEALKAIADIDVAGLRRQRADLRAQFRHIAPGVPAMWEEPGETEAPTIESDSYYCAYCGKRTIALEALRLFSSAFRTFFHGTAIGGLNTLTWFTGHIRPAMSIISRLREAETTAHTIVSVHAINVMT